MKDELKPIIDQLTKSSEEFKRKLISILSKSKSIDRVELAKLISEIDFWKGLDLETQVKLDLNDLFTQYDKQIVELLKFAEVQNVRNVFSVNRNLLEAMKYFRGEELLGRAKTFSDQLKNTMISSIINGKSFEKIKDELKNVPLTSPQLNTVISTGYNDYGRSIINLTYKDIPDQRFLYYGTIIPTSSKQCTFLLMNQNMQGYLRTEIENGITTPYGVIDWNGRTPNFNCDDRWYPVTDLLKKTIIEFQERNKLLAAEVLNK